MGAKILFRDSQGRDGQVDLSPGVPCYVGRGADCAIRTDDGMVSRKHSMIKLENNKYVVEDLGSSNGTHVNEQRVSKYTLNHNDVVRCGSLWLRYIEDGPIVPQVAKPVQQPAAPAMPAANRSGLQAELDDLQANFDREVADGKRLRAELATMREKLQEYQETIRDRDDQVAAHGRVADELRDELGQTRDELSTARVHLGQMSEDMQHRERQLERAQEDTSKLKEEMGDLTRQLGEVSKSKDEGWRKLNEQLSEIEHLREVINEQERMLEERRVGLMSQQEAIKELRSDKDESIRHIAQIKSERDELLADDSRRNAQLQAVEEENARLGKLLQDLQSGGGGGSFSAELTEEIKELRINLKKIEADRDRLLSRNSESDQRIDDLDAKIASLEIDLREANDARATAESSRAVAEEALAKAESDRHKSAEKALETDKERDTMREKAEEARRETERLQKRLAELEAQAAEVAESGDAGEDFEAKHQALEEKFRELEAKSTEAERRVSTLQAELEAARIDAKAAPQASGEASAGPPTNEIVEKATEVYEMINDVLSEIRNNLMLVQGEFDPISKERSDDSSRIIEDTIETLIGNAEDAKGALRGLRELTELG